MRTMRYLALGLLVVFHAFGSSAVPAAQTESSVQSTLTSLVERLERSEIGKIEILAVPVRIMTPIAIKADDLDRNPEYRLVVRDVRKGALRRPLLEALRSLTASQSENPGDLRWGVIFYDVEGVRLAGLYFDRYGHRGAIDSVPVEMQGNFFNWLNDKFSGCFP
jgi:hypothetical protein